MKRWADADSDFDSDSDANACADVDANADADALTPSSNTRSDTRRRVPSSIGRLFWVGDSVIACFKLA